MSGFMRIPDPLPEVSCVCLEPGWTCQCTDDERALRNWEAGLTAVAMTPAQREWCLEEISAVEGYRREEYEASSDAGLAGGVLSAWADFCRDKGIWRG